MTGFLALFPLIVVVIAPLATIPQRKIGYVFVRDGRLLDPTLIKA
jgi:hypothetical protein